LFPATAWTLVERALEGDGDAGEAALNDLMERYWRPIYVHIRRGGKPAAEAEDLTQAYFAHLLERRLLDRVRVRRVRFRAYLRGVLEHFLANEARTASARKRSGGRRLEIGAVEEWLACDAPGPSAAAFDTRWALERLESAVRRLREELRTSGREWVADALLRRVGFGAAPAPAAVRELAAAHGVGENQMSVALHRARGRLRELILEEIRDSVGSDAEAAEELNEMFAALAARR
jgi:RNA polymerase sigma-70 factor (ECF subfamily)